MSDFAFAAFVAFRRCCLNLTCVLHHDLGPTRVVLEEVRHIVHLRRIMRQTMGVLVSNTSGDARVPCVFLNPRRTNRFRATQKYLRHANVTEV